MQKTLENSAFLFVLALVSLAFFFLLSPFFGAILWGCVLAVLFYPLQRWLLSYCARPNLMALVTLLACVCIGIVPAIFIILSFLHQGAQLYQQLQSGQINPAVWLQHFQHNLPFVQEYLVRFNLDINSLVQQFSDSALSASRFLAQHAVKLGQSTVQFFISLCLMLYLLFFMLRDGGKLIRLLVRCVPLGDEREELLIEKFAEVARATVKGNLVVAIIQGTLGGLIFWFLGIPGPLLWGVVMVFMSMVPVVGAAIIWAPIALYLLVTGSLAQGIILVAFGVVVIGLVDNLLRPLLVGRDIKMPDYLVLLSTLGGIGLFGLNGFILGPLVAALFMAFWRIFANDFFDEHLTEEG